MDFKLKIVLVLLIIVIPLSYLFSNNTDLTVVVPQDGGVIVEGLVGNVRFINPVIARTQTDKDIASVIFSGLTRLGDNGKIVPNLAESWTVSDDGINYEFKIRDDAIFHDGTKVTSNDVLYTIEAIQDSDVRSPLAITWQGVSVFAPSKDKVIFTLQQPYSPFIYNTTVGVLPSHLWSEGTETYSDIIFHEQNLRPIGSGPYLIEDIETFGDERARKYVLRAFSGNVLGEPYIKTLEFALHDSEDELFQAINRGDVTSVSLQNRNAFLRDLAEKNDAYDFYTANSLRIFGIFFNRNRSAVVADENVRYALNATVPREEIIDDVLFGIAESATGPIPPTKNSKSGESELDDALEFLKERGWSENEEGVLEKDDHELSFDLITIDTPEQISVATKVSLAFEKIGGEVDIFTKSRDKFIEENIRPRDFEAALFGYGLSHGFDLFHFWHSSQINDPGLNIPAYVNLVVDDLLEKARGVDIVERKELYNSVEEEIQDVLPAVFLYSPLFGYLIPNSLKGISVNEVISPENRFINIDRWHFRTTKVWKILARENI
ncbi:MAG: ABC transporter substrate-binding protein [Candidatus Campbellbacteria bacterium]|nr:ABC transporter substrate-binding protein [Candidatus Campbellbacteria bacterium]